jgi:SpoU rRNA methylase family enzyme
METVTITLITQILALAAQYGIPLVLNSLKALNKEEITQEDIDALKELIKPPEDY